MFGAPQAHVSWTRRRLRRETTGTENRGGGASPQCTALQWYNVPSHMHAQVIIARLTGKRVAESEADTASETMSRRDSSMHEGSRERAARKTGRCEESQRE